MVGVVLKLKRRQQSTYTQGEYSDFIADDPAEKLQPVTFSAMHASDVNENGKYYDNEQKAVNLTDSPKLPHVTCFQVVIEHQS